MPSNILENKFENFSRLSDEECSLVISNNLLEGLMSPVYFDWEIVAKFMTIFPENREVLCKLLNKAIRNNNQKIGNSTVSQWIKNYLDEYAYKERTPNTFFEFVSNSRSTKELNRKEKLLLMRVLRIYDYLLVKPIFDLEGPVSGILRFTMQDDSQPQSYSQTDVSTTRIEAPQKIETTNMTLTDALMKYQTINDQMIGMNPIKIDIFPQPVRPTVKNWLADYTYNLGYDSHDSITRNNYLFQNPNAKMLGPSDREKLSYILKAYDERTPVTVDTARKQIVFPATENTRYNPPAGAPSANKASDNNFQASTQPMQKEYNNFGNTVDLKKSAPENNPPQPLSRPVYQMPRNEEKPKEYTFHKLSEEKNYNPTANVNQNDISNNHPNFSTNPASRIGTSQFKPQDAPVEPEKLSFSSPHKLPYEMKEEKKAIPTPTANITENLPELKRNISPAEPTRPVQPTFNPSTPPKPTAQPLRINPATYDENEEEELPGNVVNLRKQ